MPSTPTPGGATASRWRASDDLRTVALSSARSISAPARFIAEIGELSVQPDVPARVVIDERTGTIVIGRDVQISTVAVAHGNLTVRVTEMPEVSQPDAVLARRDGRRPPSDVSRSTSGAAGGHPQRRRSAALVRGLNRIGLKPSGIIAILQAIKTAGALQADLVVQ